ncbi:MAG: hypothetical protein AAF502_20100 [Bacteroidota bacterium]
MKFFQTLLLVLISIAISQAQIKLSNSSFEGIPKDATTPLGWDPCGMNSTPDILPGHWGVERAPADGKTFIGLITREDNTWEYIGQNLNQSLKANECYTFSAEIARSPTYAGYNQPIKLKIWGGNKPCEKEQLLAFTQPITHFEWKPYDFLFFPKKSYNYLIIEAHFVDGTVIPYRGNLIMDNCSLIEVCERALAEPPVSDACEPGC